MPSAWVLKQAQERAEGLHHQPTARHGALPQFAWDQPSASPQETATLVFVRTHIVVMGEVGTVWFEDKPPGR